MTHNLIASDRVERTTVCRPTGEKIGEIQRLMIDKVSGKVAYAVLSFGGFLGFSRKHSPVPWASPKYSVQSDAYELEVADDQLNSAPSYVPGEEFDWGDRSDEIIVRHFPIRPRSGWE